MATKSSRLLSVLLVTLLALGKTVFSSPVPGNNLFETQASPDAIILGYYTNWAQYRPEPYKFFPEDIDATLFTHLCYGFAKVDDGTFKVQPYEWNDVLDYGDGGMYKRFHAHVRKQNPAIKTLISLGGWNFSQGNKIFNTAASTAESRNTFAANIIAFVRENGFDGVDIDWEYPEAPDRENFSNLLVTIRQLISEDAQKSGKPPLLLTVAVSADHVKLPSRYDVAAVAAQVDWIGVMSYDLFGSWETKTRGHTQLYPLDTSNPNEFSVARGIQAWLANAPSSKILMGMASYGRSFSVGNPSETTGYPCNFLAGASTPAPKGTYTREEGFMSYYEIQALIAQGAALCEDVSTTYSAVVRMDKTWIGFDTVKTLGLKTDFLQSSNLRGAMFWALDLDDYKAGYPLISSVSARLRGGNTNPNPKPPVPSPPSSTPSLTPVPTASIPPTVSLSPSPAPTTAVSTPTSIPSSESATTNIPKTTTTSSTIAGTTTPVTSSSSAATSTIIQTPTASNVPTTTPPLNAGDGQKSTCRSLASNIPDEWCRINGCEQSYPTICKQVATGGSSPSSAAPSPSHTPGVPTNPAQTQTSSALLPTATPTASTTLSPPSSPGSGQTSTCHSTVSNVSDEWCRANGCEDNFPTICVQLSNASAPSRQCKSTLQHIPDAYCAGFPNCNNPSDTSMCKYV